MHGAHTHAHTYTHTHAQALMCRAEAELTTPYAKLMCLGLGLMFLGKQDQAEATLEVRACLVGT